MSHPNEIQSECDGDNDERARARYTLAERIYICHLHRHVCSFDVIWLGRNWICVSNNLRIAHHPGPGGDWRFTLPPPTLYRCREMAMFANCENFVDRCSTVAPIIILFNTRSFWTLNAQPAFVRHISVQKHLIELLDTANNAWTAVRWTRCADVVQWVLGWYVRYDVPSVFSACQLVEELTDVTIKRENRTNIL